MGEIIAGIFLVGIVLLAAAAVKAAPRGKVPGSSNDSRVDKLARAIALAEGFGRPGAIPTVAHNPGDLKLGDIGHGAIQGKTVFADDEAGWQALRSQINLMYANRSKYYAASDSFRTIARVWTGGDRMASWLTTVTGQLGIPADTKLNDWLERRV